MKELTNFNKEIIDDKNNNIPYNTQILLLRFFISIN